MAEPKHEPRVIIQTENYRVIVKDNPPFERKQRPPDVIIEKRSQAGMGEPYWGPVHHLFDTKMSMTKDERLLMEVFGEFSKQANEKAPELRPDERVLAEMRVDEAKELRNLVAELLIEVGNTLTGDVEILPTMPFNNRDNAMGLAPKPADMDKLHKLFPGFPYPCHPVQLVAKLLELAARELRR